MADDADRAFLQTTVAPLRGWLDDYTALRTMDLLALQARRDIRGPLVEIGVYAGKYLSVLLRSAAAQGETVFGVDTFESISADEVRANLGPDATEERLTLVAQPSGALTPIVLFRMIGGQGPRFFSVDGSHEAPDVHHDLTLADAILAPNGVIAVDDFFNPLTPGVNEGVHRFFHSTRNLAPFACLPNKLFLARPYVAGVYRARLEEIISADNDLLSLRFRRARERARHLVERPLWGHPMLLVPSAANEGQNLV